MDMLDLEAEICDFNYAHNKVQKGSKKGGSQGNILEQISCVYVIYILPETTNKHANKH